MARGNPGDLFPTEEPLRPEQLIGRGDDVLDISLRLKLGTNLVISSPRRTGKTSTCDAALAQLRHNEDLYVAKVDLFKIEGVSQLADELIEAVLRNRPAVGQMLRSLKQTGRTLYDSVGLSMGARLLGTGDLDGVDINLLPKLCTDPVRHLDYALELPQRIAQTDKKQLVLCIDEFQDLQRVGDSYAIAWSAVLKRKMRAAFQYSRNVSFLFLGSHYHMMSTLFGDPTEPFFSFGGFYELHPISESAWADGLSRRFQTDGTSIDEGALERLIELGDGHPRATMLIAQQAHLMSVISDARRVSQEIVTFGYRAALRSDRPQHDAWLERVRSIRTPAINRIAPAVLTTIARHGKPYSTSKQTTSVSRALDALRDAGFIEHLDNGEWTVLDPLFREYLRGSS